MSEGAERAMHPNLESYYDRATDRVAVDIHVVACPGCQAWLAEIHERIGRFACIEFVELVTDYLEDAVTEPQRAAIEDHLSLCEGCRNYLDEVQATIATIGRTGASAGPEPSERVRAGLMTAFRLWRSTGKEGHPPPI